jgi:enterobacteria phage integrase
MAALGHTTLAEAERYTREADRRRGGTPAVLNLNDHGTNRVSYVLGKIAKTERKTES